MKAILFHNIVRFGVAIQSFGDIKSLYPPNKCKFSKYF